MKTPDFAEETRAAAYIAAAVLLVHLFSPAPLDLATTAFHGAGVWVCFTAGYVAAFRATNMAAARLREPLASSPLVRVWAPSLAAVLIGIALLKSLSMLTPAPLYFDHGREDWLLNMAAVWLALTAALHQSAENRTLSKELQKIGAQARASPEHGARAEVVQIELDADGRTQRLAASDIVCVEAEENYCRVHTIGQRALMVRATLAGLAEQLGPAGFVRTHRSFLINLAEVADIGQDGRSYTAQMRGGLAAPIARGRLEAFMDAWRQARGT